MLAAIGVDEATYTEALVEAVRVHGVGSFERAWPALRVMPLAEIAEVLCRPGEDRPVLEYHHVPPKLAELLIERADPPEVLRAVATSLGGSRAEVLLADMLRTRADG